MQCMTTAVIGTGNIGGAVARRLTRGGESVLLASKDKSKAEALAQELGTRAKAATVQEAIAGADAVFLGLWLDTIRELIPLHASLLAGKVVIDPSNPLGFDKQGHVFRTLPEHHSAASVVEDLLPASAHYVKAFGSLGADLLASSAEYESERVVLFYATDDDYAKTTIERLIRSAGFEPLQVGGVAAAVRIEAPGGDLQGKALALRQALVAVAGAEALL